MSRDWELWTREVGAQCVNILVGAKVLEAVRVTSQWIPSKGNETYRAIMELLCPATNAFITPNLKLGFFIKMRDVFGLPILEKFYEEFVPLISILEKDQRIPCCDSHHKFKAGTWIKNMMPKGPAGSITLLEDPGILEKKVVTVLLH